MRKRGWLIALITAFVMGLSIPVVADHVQEPTRPADDVTLQIFKYHERATTLLTACDGSETYREPFFRIDVTAFPAADWPDIEAPTEHFQVRIAVFSPRVGDPRQSSLLWVNTWNHQNVKPHPQRVGPVRFGKLAVADQWQIQTFVPGQWKVTMRVIGDASGDVFEKECVFQVGPPL